MHIYVAEQQTWTGRLVIVDLCQLYSRTPKQIAAFVGKRTMVIPQTCIGDVVGAEESKQGTRKQRLHKVYRALRTLFWDLGVAMQVVDTHEDLELSRHVPRFLDRGREEWIAGVEQRASVARNWLIDIAKGIEMSIRDAWEIQIDDEDPADLENIMDPDILRWLRGWANSGKDESGGRLAAWIADWIQELGHLNQGTPYKRAEALVHAVKFLRHFQRRVVVAVQCVVQAAEVGAGLAALGCRRRGCPGFKAGQRALKAIAPVQTAAGLSRHPRTRLSRSVALFPMNATGCHLLGLLLVTGLLYSSKKVRRRWSNPGWGDGFLHFVHGHFAIHDVHGLLRGTLVKGHPLLPEVLCR